MANLRLTLSCNEYDRTRFLVDGTIKAEGIDLDILALPSEERHRRFSRGLEFDVCELQMGVFLGWIGRGAPFRAIPVFPHRKFCHGNVLVHAASGIQMPEDFAGKIVGMDHFIAFEKGYFREQNLSVEYVRAGGGVATPALLSGDLHLSTSAGSALSAGLRGGPVKIVYTNLSKPSYKLIATKPEIQSLKDLIGKKIAINSFGDTQHLALLLLLKKYRIPSTGVLFIAMGRSSRQFFLVVEHLTLNKTYLSKELLHFRPIACHESEDCLDAVVFSGFRELADELLSNSVMAICRIDADNFDPCNSAR